MTVHSARQWAVAQGVSARDAEVLLRALLQTERAWLLAHPEAPLSTPQQDLFTAQIHRRLAHTPLQYLTGQQEFYGLVLEVSPAVLIPRPETELLVEAVLGWVARQEAIQRDAPLEIADVGTGSGAVALALAIHLPKAHLLALDLSPEALQVANRNARRLGLSPGRVGFVTSDLLSALEPQEAITAALDVVVSNPPYVPERDAPELEAQVRDYEPHLALFAGQDGLGVYRRLIPQASRLLRPGGLLALEFGFGQKPSLLELLNGWTAIRFCDDYAGIPRVVTATRP